MDLALQLMALLLYGNRSTPTKAADFTAWEIGIYEWSKQVNKGEYRNHSLVKLLVSHIRIAIKNISFPKF